MCSYIHFLNTFPGLVLLLCICPTCVSYFLWLILTVLIKIYPLSWLWVISPLALFQQRCGLGLLHLILLEAPGRPSAAAWQSSVGRHYVLLLPEGMGNWVFVSLPNFCFPVFLFLFPFLANLLLMGETTGGPPDEIDALLLFPAGNCGKGYDGGRNGNNWNDMCNMRPQAHTGGLLGFK